MPRLHRYAQTGQRPRVGFQSVRRLYDTWPKPPRTFQGYGGYFHTARPFPPPSTAIPHEPSIKLTRSVDVCPEHERIPYGLARRGHCPPPAEKESPRRTGNRRGPSPKAAVATFEQCRLVEPRRIELRSILNRPRGSTSLVGDRDSERIGSPTNVAAPSRFSLFPGHTGYVPGSIPLKLTPWPVRGNTSFGDHQVAVRQPWRPACSSRS